MDALSDPNTVADEPLIVVEPTHSGDHDQAWAGWTLEEILAREG
jgi:hypothetical protein